MIFDIVSLENLHVKEGFNCGIEELNRYFFQQAGQDVRKHYATLFVAVESATNRIIGFYTLSNTSVKLDDIPFSMREKMAKYYDIPAILLGRLAVDVGAQGIGVGAQLLADAVIRSARNISAWVLMTVYAKNDIACSFYKKFGFESLLDDERHLFITRKNLEASFIHSKGAP